MGPVTSLLTGIILEGIFYGFYCVIFGLYLQIQLKKKAGSKGPFTYALTAIFILCTVFLAVQMAQALLEVDILIQLCQTGSSSSWKSVNFLSVAADALYSCIDLISQGVLIYRCWMMWRQPLIVFVPVILAVACFGTSLTCIIFLIKSPGFDKPTGPTDLPAWFGPANLTFFSMSLAVNAGVTGLIVFKILIIYRESKSRNVCVSGRGPPDLYPIISIMVESGLITFVGQLVQIILYKIYLNAFPIVFGIVAMLYGISSTIVLVRFVMGLSYDDETLKTTSDASIHIAKPDDQYIEVDSTRIQVHT